MKKFTYSLILVLMLSSIAFANDNPEAKAFAKIVIEEYRSLLLRRSSIENGNQKDIHKNSDKHAIDEIDNKILPQIDSGDFDILVQSSGLIAVETSDRRITLSAPNDSWDDEFRAIVKYRANGNKYALNLIQKSESLEGKSYPNIKFKNRQDFNSDSEYGEYIKKTIKKGMRVCAIKSVGSIERGLCGTYWGTNEMSPPACILWDKDLNAGANLIDGMPKEKKSWVYWVEWHEIEIIQ